ncbi:hypothetical protein V8E55_006908 [Tylopilus felleus]
MDALLAMQNLLRLRALIRDSPLSSGDVFGTKELHPVVQSPVAELATQDTRFPPSWESPVKSSTSEEPVPQAIIPIPKSFLGKLSRYSSLRRNRMLKSGSKSDGEAKQDNALARQRERTVSMATGTALVNYTGQKTIWREHDSYLPRSNSSPLLKRKHARNRTEDNVSPPIPTLPSPRPSTSHSSKVSSSGSHSAPLQSPRRCLDVATVTISSVAFHEPVPDIPDTLRRTTSRTTVATEVSNESQTTFVPSNCSWKPPTNWAGPSTLAPTDEVESKSKLLGWFSRKKSSDNSKGGSMRVPTRLIRARSLRELKTMPLRDTVGPVEGRTPAARGAPVPSGVAVKIQCSQRDKWHEKPMADIIPKLRNLRTK